MSHRRRRCNACLDLVVLEDAFVAEDEEGVLVFCDEACAADFERELNSDELARLEHRRDAEDFDPVAEDTDD